MAKKNIIKRKSTQKPKSISKISIWKKIRTIIWKIFLWFNIISLFLVILFKWVPVPFTPLMIIRYFENTSANKEVQTKHDWVSIEDISQNLQKAVIASEDARFFEHNGYDFNAMWKAAGDNIKGKKLKGGSTISQQTAKNVFLWQGRSYIRKILEAYYTFLIELIWGKERIMEVYLNSIEMGNGVYGAEAACQHWYKISCKTLTKSQAAGIAIILPSPRKYKPTAGTKYLNKKLVKVKREMWFVKLKY